jgi:hypothetical protein
VLCRLAPDDGSLVQLGVVSGIVSKPESVSDSEPMPDPETVPESLLAPMVLLAGWLGCHVVQFPKLREHDGTWDYRYFPKFRAVFCSG